MVAQIAAWWDWWDAAAIFVALCALYLTIQSNRATREHNRLSVTPRLTTTTSRNLAIDGLGTVLQVRVLLTNVGLGPAVVKTSEVLVDGAVVPAEASEDVTLLLQKTLPEIQLGAPVSFMKLNKEHALAVGVDHEIVACRILNPPVDVKKQLERFNFRVRYESLYGQPFIYDSRDHTRT